MEFVGHQEDAVVLALEGSADVLPVQKGVQLLAVFREGVGARFRVNHLAGEGDQGVEFVALLGDVLPDGLLPSYSFLAAAGHDHGFGLATEQRCHVLVEMVDHHLHALRDVVLVQAHPTHDALHGFGTIDLFGVDLFVHVRQGERGFVAGVIAQHVQDEAFFNRLAHGIDVKRCRNVVRCRLACRVRTGAKQLQRLVLWCGREGHVGDAQAGVAAGFCRHLGGQNILGADLAAIVKRGNFSSVQDFLEVAGGFAGLR